VKIFVSSPEPKPRIKLNVSFYLRFIHKDILIRIQKLQFKKFNIRTVRYQEVIKFDGRKIREVLVKIDKACTV